MNEFDDNHLYWEKACIKFSNDYQIIDLTKHDWLDQVVGSNFDGCLTCPSGREWIFKNLYDERIYIIEKVLNKFCYPSYREIIIHENKKFLSYWLKANNIPHPETFVFYNKHDAIEYANHCKLPIVAKFNIGASGKGVKIFRKRALLIKYIQEAFSKGIHRNWGPNLVMGDFQNRIKRILRNPSIIKKRIQVYKKNYEEIQKGFVILQEYVPHDFEWRIVKIGDSYFAHQKIKSGDKASGTKGINYVLPPPEHLDFVKHLCDTYKFNSMAVDAFEDGRGGLLVNELQTIFGHVQEYICAKNDRPGQLVFKDNKWIFEEGMFNSNLSYNLRLENAIQLLKTINEDSFSKQR